MKKSESPLAETIFKKVGDLLSIDLKARDINDYYFLGNSDTSPLKIELCSFLKKKDVFQKKSCLKGSNISIVNDLTPTQRKQYKLLKKHLNLAKQDGNKQCFIKKNRLHVNNDIYEISDLENLEKRPHNIYTPNSAPPTPTPKTKQTSDINQAHGSQNQTNTPEINSNLEKQTNSKVKYKPRLRSVKQT
ncbi:hypothetical protein JTB14_026124 [Gonioctena quinquepunctata]|nr:hypothetical protein JTB14_026124 [Gonioctena quinquepunctata]